MAQFHVYRLARGRLVLDLQSDLIDAGTRVVAPLHLLRDGPAPISRLEPILEIFAEPYVLHTAEMAAIPSKLLAGPPIADISDRSYDIKSALDMVFWGF
ncbi:CcdB family protein [Salinarimonas ramus]|uniref:Toxin CcdB n=1 Tax=Salinarimonas ramus TaxID=690164 RepID=A0A917QG67_9HYPH|nr:CcdB family protein [Salinarimonas ramus]GGK47481.1 hypothetical protein GCM10011322_38170 [Salinarimonas ramus]